MDDKTKNIIIDVVSYQIKYRRKALEKISLSYGASTFYHLENAKKNLESEMAYIEREKQFLKDLNDTLKKQDISCECEIDEYVFYENELSEESSILDYVLRS
ncbi:MAG: hypothetical protein WC812_02665 [Candidatus Pacearchaeota archaeon]|jgi:cell division protein FtsB